MVSKTKRLIFVSALAFSILTAGAYGAKITFAQDSEVQETVVQKIATKFNLKTSDVQSVFDQARLERQAQLQQLYEQKLTDAVSSGKLTEAKKQLLLVKHKELIAEHTQEMAKFQTMTPEERRAERLKERAELEKWASDNGIDISYLFGFGKGGMHKGGRRTMMGNNN